MSTEVVTLEFTVDPLRHKHIDGHTHIATKHVWHRTQLHSRYTVLHKLCVKCTCITTDEKSMAPWRMQTMRVKLQNWMSSILNN